MHAFLMVGGRSLRQGKETKRETLLKQIKDVDELMNEEPRFPAIILVNVCIYICIL